MKASVKRPMIVIPYVEKVSEAIVRIMKKHNVPVAATMEDFEGFFGTPEGQTRQGRHNRMCIQGTLCQL